MSRNRVKADSSSFSSGDEPDSRRSDFERDFDRILFSNAFRRLNYKTQVFPFPDDDVVHSRLTHSIEVAAVGRTLGRRIGEDLVAHYKDELAFNAYDVAHVVSAACLAHDIGNPPFGHAGERAICEYFDEEGSNYLEGLTNLQREDLAKFDGNPQGFRILSKTLFGHKLGLHLTSAVLATFSKYPRPAGLEKEARVGWKKAGYFQAEARVFQSVAKEVGLVEIGDAWARHPLVFLVEAADDICYSVLDLEDGHTLNLLSTEEIEDAFAGLFRKSPNRDEALSKLHGAARVRYLRSLVIKDLRDACAKEFLEDISRIVSGNRRLRLAESIVENERLQGLKKLAEKRCYHSRDVLEREIAGYKVVKGLLGVFVPAVAARSPTKIERAARDYLDKEGFESGIQHRYENLMRIIDFVSGMTDRYALATYRKLTGMALPGNFQ